MNYNLIDITPVKAGYGRVWQGGSVDADVQTLPNPLLIVCMDSGELNESFIQHGKSVEGVLAVWIDDQPEAVLSDTVLLGLVKAITGWLENGGNVYVHCAAGVSRASYCDIALHMYILKISFDEAFKLIQAQRPIISPNSGFVAHLRHMEPILTAQA